MDYTRYTRNWKCKYDKVKRNSLRKNCQEHDYSCDFSSFPMKVKLQNASVLAIVLLGLICLLLLCCKLTTWSRYRVVPKKLQPEWFSLPQDSEMHERSWLSGPGLCKIQMQTVVLLEQIICHKFLYHACSCVLLINWTQYYSSNLCAATQYD